MSFSRSAGEWIGCDHCESYWVCPSCASFMTGKGAKVPMNKHVSMCKREKGAPAKKSKK